MYATKKEYEVRRSNAKQASDKHKKLMKGKKTILVPHPTLKNTFIEKL
jgi:Fe-S oxidoreductase